MGDQAPPLPDAIRNVLARFRAMGRDDKMRTRDGAPELRQVRPFP